MNKISVSLPSELVVWNEDDGIYSIINSKASTVANNTTTTAAATVSTVVVGWLKGTDGTWTYVKADGSKATGWLQDGNTWYYLNESGVMLSNTTVDGYTLGINGAWIQ